MQKILVIGDTNLDLLKQILKDSGLIPIQEQEPVVAENVYTEPYEEVDELDDEDLRQIVQLRLLDDHESSPEYVIERWADTDIDASELDQYRAQFPEQEYRLVAVYDEIVDEFDSVDQQEVTLEDEIGLLKAEVLQLKSQLAYYEGGQT